MNEEIVTAVFQYKMKICEFMARDGRGCCGGGAAGSVYGSGVYTADSALCAAAQHAGAIPAAGGTVKINKAAGCPKYTGTVANGMTTTSWGSYPASFFFVGHGDGKCAG